MAAPNSSTSNQAVVNTKFCIDSTTTFTVRRKPAVASNVGGMDSVIQVLEEEKFKLVELASKEEKFKLVGLALEDSDGQLILTVKPERLNLTSKKQWNVFRTMESDLKPLFTVKTSKNYSKIEVSEKGYTIEGSFAKPEFKISHISGGIVAEVKQVEQVKLNNQVEEIYSVYNVEVKKGYDQAFIFGLVAVFEQIQRLTKK